MLACLRGPSHRLIIFRASFFNALAAFTSLAMFPFILLSHLRFLFWVLQSICNFYAHAKSSRAQILLFRILVKEYQVCRRVFYRVAGTGSHVHVKIFRTSISGFVFLPLMRLIRHGGQVIITAGCGIVHLPSAGICHCSQRYHHSPNRHHHEMQFSGLNFTG